MRGDWPLRQIRLRRLRLNPRFIRQASLENFRRPGISESWPANSTVGCGLGRRSTTTTGWPCCTWSCRDVGAVSRCSTSPSLPERRLVAIHSRMRASTKATMKPIELTSATAVMERRASNTVPMIVTTPPAPCVMLTNPGRPCARSRSSATAARAVNTAPGSRSSAGATAVEYRAP